MAEWQEYRSQPGANKTQVDEQYILLYNLQHPGEELSTDILYRKWRAVREDDLNGLIDKRGKWRKGRSSINETVWQAFLSFWRDEAQHPSPDGAMSTPSYGSARSSRSYTIPSQAMRRSPGTSRQMCRCPSRCWAAKAKRHTETAAPHISVVYTTIWRATEWWIADNHTFDVISKRADGTRHRLYLTAFFDARSGIFTACHHYGRAVLAGDADRPAQGHPAIRHPG